MAKPNYQFEKRQKDLAKKKKQEEKRLRKLGKSNPPVTENPGLTPADGGGNPSAEEGKPL